MLEFECWVLIHPPIPRLKRVSGFADGLVDSFSVECNQQEMVVTLSTMVSFHGMVYPRGLTKQSPCMNEFDVPVGKDFVYRVPLRSCNTMLTDTVRFSHDYYIHGGRLRLHYIDRRFLWHLWPIAAYHVLSICHLVPVSLFSLQQILINDLLLLSIAFIGTICCGNNLAARPNFTSLQFIRKCRRFFPPSHLPIVS